MFELGKEGMTGSMGTDEFQRWPASKFKDPIEVESGIRLTRDLSDVGQNWWSKRWLAIIEAFGLGVRLERAKMYATRGQVLSINVENGVVRAQVQGSDEEPYRVTLAVRTIPPAIWKSILQDLGASSHFGISLAARTLPAEEEIESVFSSNGVLLFPDRQGEMQTKCSCLDWSNPCKHIAAVYLLLAAEFDRDPYLIFKLRGLKMDDLFSLLKPADSTEASPDEAGMGSRIMMGAQQASQAGMPVMDAGMTAEVEKPPAVKPLTIENFWKNPAKIAAFIGEWQPSEETAALPVSLGEFPFWRGKDEFLPTIRLAYQSAPQIVTELLSALAAAPARIDE